MATKTEKTGQTCKLKSRKFILTSIVLIIAIILVVCDKISGSEFLALITVNSGLYGLSNSLASKKDV